MRYCAAKKLIILLKEYRDEHNTIGSNAYLENDLVDLINELSKYNYIDLYDHSKECLKELTFSSMDELISYLEILPVEIGENQAERGIAYAEALSDYIYENGYDSVMQGGFDYNNF